ncbi:MAG: 3'-5' exonuclease [Clostridia bacterium]
MDQILSGLNDMQKKAVLAKEGPVLVLAGAGSGKTSVLTRRIVYLVVEKKVPPSCILAITFTNKAAREMKTRVEELMGGGIRFQWVGTFHSMCVRMLRIFADRFGYSRNFVIYDSDDQKALMKQCIKEANIDSTMYPPGGVLYHVSRAKDELVGHREFIEKHQGDYKMQVIGSLYESYQKKLSDNSAMDFDDLIFNTVRMLRSYDDIREYFQGMFRHVLIDEYQDTNTAQNVLAEILAEKHHNVFVVGDDDQSIYGWRGANIRNILEFESKYPDCEVIRLERNYRSTSCILEAANTVIARNMGRKGKTLWTEKGKGENIRFYKAYNEHNEALFIASEIEKQYGISGAYKDMAVLYRMNAQSRAIERALRERGIPYRIFGSISFYDRKEIKDVLAYMKLILNHHDNLMFRRIINEPKRGIGKTTLERLEAHAIHRETSMFQAAEEAHGIENLRSQADKLKEFTGMIRFLSEFKDKNNLESFYDKLLEATDILTVYRNENTPEAQVRMDNINELKSSIITYSEEYFEREGSELTFETYLEDISLESISEEEQTEDYVSLMTLHSAKGLEFPVVFITGMEEGIFPGAQSLDSDVKIEEERRLCYVGITRAQDKLYLLNAMERTLYGKTTINQDSRFLKEIPGHLMTDHSRQAGMGHLSKGGGIPVSRGGKPYEIRGIRTEMHPVVDVVEGQRVEHKKFGKGTVVRVSGEGKDRMITIQFDMAGRKTLLSAYARLTVPEERENG